MSQYQGKVTLIVNVASQCGYTPQYKGLQALHTELKDKGFAVLGFPCNDFGAQEPGSADEIRTFCSTKYAVDFPMFAKIGTKKGNEQSPLYAMLEQATGKLPGWNFCKYLVGKDGKPIAFYASGASPDGKELRDAIAAARDELCDGRAFLCLCAIDAKADEVARRIPTRLLLALGLEADPVGAELMQRARDAVEPESGRQEQRFARAVGQHEIAR
jgi:glutathione peroxidase